MIRKDKDLSRYCSEPLENIENYDKAIADDKHMWDCHHRNEICEANRSRSDRGVTSKEQLIADGMYYNRPACELIFLRHDEHRKLHAQNMSEETKHKISEKMRGKPSCNKGKPRSLETKLKMSKSLKGKTRSLETRRKMSESHKGKSLSEETRRKMSESRKGKTRSLETRLKISESLKGKSPWNKGKSS